MEKFFKKKIIPQREGKHTIRLEKPYYNCVAAYFLTISCKFSPTHSRAETLPFLALCSHIFMKAVFYMTFVKLYVQLLPPKFRTSSVFALLSFTSAFSVALLSCAYFKSTFHLTLF